MNTSPSNKVNSFACWVGSVVTALVLVLQVSVEVKGECEGPAVVLRESELATEPGQRTVCQHQHTGSTSGVGHRRGPAALIGHSGLRLSATLLAPLRC